MPNFPVAISSVAIFSVAAFSVAVFAVNHRPISAAETDVVINDKLQGSLQCFDAVGWAAGRASGL